MKAFIIYGNIASALRVINSPSRVARRRDISVDWKIGVCRANLLRFRNVADEALTEGAAADLVVLTGGEANSLRPWLKEWLERWSQHRLIRNAALALVQDKTSAAYSTIRASELSVFARSHHLSFITDYCNVENATVPTSLSFGVNQSHVFIRSQRAIPFDSAAPSEMKGVSPVL